MYKITITKKDGEVIEKYSTSKNFVDSIVSYAKTRGDRVKVEYIQSAEPGSEGLRPLVGIVGTGIGLGIGLGLMGAFTGK